MKNLPVGVECAMQTDGWAEVKKLVVLISNFSHVLKVVRFLLDNSPASEFYGPTFRHVPSVPSS